MSYKIIFMLIIATFSVSTSPIIAKMLTNVPAVAIAFWRMAFASIILWIYYFINPTKIYQKKNLNKTFIAGILLGFHFAFFFGSIKYTTISNATFLGTLAPLFILIIEILIFKNKFSPIIYISLTISFLGSIIIFSGDLNFEIMLIKGNLFAILCSLWLAVSFLISSSVRKVENTISYSRVLYLSATLCLLIISFFQKLNLFSYTINDYFGLLLLGVIPTLIGHNFMYYSMKYVSPAVVSLFPLGEPVIASIFAFYLFNELISINIILGGTFILIGLFLIISKKVSK